jgi:uncharacterized membrane protein
VRQRALERFAGFVCLLLAASVALSLLGWLPTRKFVPEGGVAAMLAAIAVSVIASVVGVMPVFLAERKGTPQLHHVLATIVVRFLLLLAGIGYVLLLDTVERAPFLIWVAVSYLLLLPLDVRYAVRAPATKADSSGSQE